MEALKLGDTVLFHVEKDNGGSVTKLDWPGIVYKIYEGEPGDPVGLTVLFDGIPTRYGKVMYSKEVRTNCWRHLE